MNQLNELASGVYTSLEVSSNIASIMHRKVLRFSINEMAINIQEQWLNKIKPGGYTEYHLDQVEHPTLPGQHIFSNVILTNTNIVLNAFVAKREVVDGEVIAVQSVDEGRAGFIINFSGMEMPVQHCLPVPHLPETVMGEHMLQALMAVHMIKLGTDSYENKGTV